MNIIFSIKRATYWLFHSPKDFLDNCLCYTVELWPTKLFLEIRFWLYHGYWPNFRNPKTFSEKINWLKINDIHLEYCKMVDKFEVKEYVSSIIGEENIIPTIRLWDKVEDIDWDSLPNQFVIKSTSDSGSIVICKDKTKLNIEEAKTKLSTLGNRDYYKVSKEYPYKNLKHRYIAEKYLEDESGCELKDYKIFCFGGEPRLIEVDFNRFSDHHRNIYDTEWNLLDLQIHYPYDYNRTFEKPQNLFEMLNIARSLSKGMPHVRVDLYNIRGKIYFGELTFFHGSGMEQFTPKEWDYKLGEMIILPITK